MANRFEAWGKRILRAPLLLIPAGPPPPVPPPPGAVRNVVLLRPDERIGNLVLLTPMIDAMRRAWPGVTIDLLAGGAVAPLAIGDPRLSNVIVFDKRVLVRNPLAIVPIGRRLRAGRYDLAVDASHSHSFSLTAAFLTAATRARWRLGYLRDDANRVLNVGIRREPGVRRYTAELYMDLFRAIVPDATGGPLTFPVTEAETAAARRVLGAYGIGPDTELIGMHPGGRGSKRWPVERFVALARRLATRPGARVALFTGPGEEDLLPAFPEDVAVRLTRMPLRTLAAAFGCCRLFISGDTGPMHLAAAVGTPVLALFIHGNADMFAPKGDGHRHLWHPEGPAVADVHAAAVEMLTARGHRPRPATDSK